jgi:general secretion pathway protein K
MDKGFAGWRQPWPDQRGAALLTVLLVTGLITVMAVAMISRQQVEIRRTANIIEADQAYWLAKGAERWAVNLLKRDQERDAADTLAEEWAQGLFPIAAAGGTVAGTIIDLQGRFNLNNLLATDSARQEMSRLQFSRLLTLCALPPQVLDGVVDWLDADGDAGWAEDWAYANLDTPYRTANQRLVSPSELLQVQGMTAQGYHCLEPLVCALPAKTAININTAPALVLASLADGISQARAEAMVEMRPAKGYGELAAFLNAPEWVGLGLTGTNLTLGSHFFLVHAQTTMGRAKCTLFSLVQRQPGRVRVWQRTVGAY